LHTFAENLLIVPEAKAGKLTLAYMINDPFISGGFLEGRSNGFALPIEG
jgi:hypothetical protein